MNTKTIIKLISIIAICALVFFGYRYFFGQSGEVVGVVTVGADGQTLAGAPVTDYESQQFLTLLASVQDVGNKLREDFVRDPFFLLLKDYTVPVLPKPISRANPFLPIGLGGPYIINNNRASMVVESLATTTASSTPANLASTTKKTTTKAKTTTGAPDANTAFDGSF